ncbi:FkbM family methyltransferase [Dyella acidisoli]|uniref:Methyltransferase FkbM domain-containing protein n=1 Tax=Dyella acidisoli TaxID=1867834 RepID=A0ABQ5XRK6_9GAMM|nr:FkbM family methyltransferase [Dyella acidisoli]GLQ93019.1 hypothetical protein GCM10007901_19700 [Dyella acidisoli]
MSMISYAQNYEDVMLVRALADIGEGFYIDVGAQHPINGSVTKAFQSRGWHGVNIEPVERWFRLICDDRPQDINLNTAISDEPGYIELYDVEDTGLSTVSQDYARRYAKEGWSVVKKRLKAHTLNAVFRTYGPKDVHFLKVDVEGAEAAVLRSLDLNRFRPWIILVEATKPNSPEPTFGEWEHLLLDANYIFAYDDGLNRFYVALEHEDRITYFSRPPNFFDDFVSYSESWTRTQMDRLSQEVELERAESQRVNESYHAVAARAERLENMQVDILNGLDERLVAFGRRFEQGMSADILNGLDERLVAFGKHFEQSMSTDILNGLDERLAAFGNRFEEAFKKRAHGNVDEQLERLAQRLNSVDQAIERVHERLGFAHNVQAALLDVMNREHAIDAKLQQILLSRSWRLTKGPRFIARVLRALVRGEWIGNVRPSNAKLTRLLIAATNRPALRRIGSVLLSATPGLKARLVRTVVGDAKPQPLPPIPRAVVPRRYTHLPARAREVRSMLDRATKSS